MKKDYLTDEQVEIEIARLLDSDDVRLAKKVEQIRNRRRQYMYTLRVLERHGKKLAEQGYDLDNIETMFGEDM